VKHPVYTRRLIDLLQTQWQHYLWLHINILNQAGSLENRILTAAKLNKNGTDPIRHKQGHACSDTHITCWLCSVTNFPVLSLQKTLSIWQAQTTNAERTMGKVNVSGSTKTTTSQTSSSLLTDSQLVRYICISVLSALLSDKKETKNVLTTAPGTNNMV